MLDPSFSDVLTVWVAPAVVLIVGTIVTLIAGAVIGRAKDRRKAEIEAVSQAKKDREALDEAMVKQVQEMHAAFIGEKPTPFNPRPPAGVIERLDAIQKAMFGNGDPSRGVVARLERIERHYEVGQQ